jgi:hypothetical protein
MPSLEDLKSDYAHAEMALNVAAEVREEALQAFMAAQGVKKRLADAQTAYELALVKWGTIGEQIEALGDPGRAPCYLEAQSPLIALRLG